MKRLAALVLGLAFLVVVKTGSAWANDPCADPTVSKVTAAVSLSGAGSTQLFAAPANGKSIALCGCDLVATSGTSPTVKVIYGTQTTNACDTGTTALSGAMAPSIGQPLALGAGGYTAAWAPAGNQMCLLLGGTTPVFAGLCTAAAY